MLVASCWGVVVVGRAGRRARVGVWGAAAGGAAKRGKALAGGAADGGWAAAAGVEWGPAAVGRRAEAPTAAAVAVAVEVPAAE